MQYPGPYAAPPPQGGASSQATLALILAIAGLFFCGCVTSIPAIFVARSELKAIDAGQSSPAGRGIATAAYWIGIVDTALVTLLMVVYLVLMVFGLAAGFAMGP